MARRQRQRFTVGPFRGMRAAWRGSADEALAYEIGNMLPVQRLLGASPLVAIPPSSILTGLTSAPPVSDNFSASNVLDANGETTEAVLDPAAAVSDQYLLHYSVDVRTLCPVTGSQAAGITVAIDTMDDGVNWVERQTIVYSVTAQAGVGACADQESAPNAVMDAFDAVVPSGAANEVMDEVSPDDADYARLDVSYSGGPITSFGEVGLSGLTDPGVGTGHVLKVRHKETGSLVVGTVEVSLKDDGAVRASWFVDLSEGVWTTEVLALSEAQANSLLNYNGGLSVSVEAAADVDAVFSCSVSWIRLTVPGGTAQQTVWAHEQKSITVAGLVPNDKVRLRIKSVQNPSLLQSFAVHGFDNVGDPSPGVTYFSGAANPVQGFGVLSDESYCAAGGELYKLDYATGVWTKYITTAQLTAAGITLTATEPVYFTPFIYQGTPAFVVNDSLGTHKPFIWTGANGTGLTLMSTVGAAGFYGQPTVYYAKLFAIKYDERNTITWSEENQPETGYETGGYNNAWTLSQTGGQPLHCLVGTNQALFYFRDTSIGSIRGPVATDFTASGVHDDVSNTIGTTSPRGAALIGSHVWVQDAEGRPHAFVPGGTELDPLWEQIADYWGRPAGDPNKTSPGDRLIFPGAWVGLDADHLVACAWAATATQAGGILFFDARTRQALAVFTPAYGDRYSVVGPGYAQATVFGTARRQPILLVGYPGGACAGWPPFFTAGTQYGTSSPARIAATPWVRLHLGYGASVVYLWDVATVVTYAGEGDGAETPTPVTPYWSASNDLTLPAAPATSKAFRTAGLTAGPSQGIGQIAGVRRNRRLTWGLEREGRHLLAAFEGAVGLESVTLEAGVMIADPSRT